MEDHSRREILKEDSLGRVLRLRAEGSDRILREACGSWVPFTGWVARFLCRRERRALLKLEGLAGVPHLDPEDSGSGRELLRNHLPGAPLSHTIFLPRDYFDHLDALVEKVHARGVCHNDLHKEQNILVLPDGRPALLDFQLASVHTGLGRAFESRCEEDLRHLQKHRRRYTRDGRGSSEQSRGKGHGLKRRPLSLVWRRTGKPLYNFVTRRVLHTRDGEQRRPSSGPWPAWQEPLGPD